MKLVFRTDASPKIGAGHLMRCSAIAEEAILQGIECVMVGDLGGINWLQQRLENIGLPLMSESDFLTQKSDRESSLVIDSYLIDPKSSFLDVSNWKKLISISDELTPQYEVDLVVHPGIHGDWYSGESEFLFGTQFIPLRKSISKVSVDLTRKIAEKIVIFGGGTDTFGFSIAVAKVLKEIRGFNEAFFVSKSSSDVTSLDSRFRSILFGDSLDLELANTDLVLTTASTSSLEIVAREIPVGIACAVENQSGYFNALSEAKVAVQIGKYTALNSWELNAVTLKELITSLTIRTELVKNSQNYIDLDGSKRIIEAIRELN